MRKMIRAAVLTAAITILSTTATLAQPVNLPVNVPGNIGNILNQKNSPLNPMSPNFGKFGKSSIPALPQPVPTTTNKTTTTPIGPGYTLPGQASKTADAAQRKRVMLYDANGRAFASVDGDYFLDTHGRRVAVIHNDAVFLNAGSGAQIGWYTDGYLTDNDGKVLATTTDQNANSDTNSATPLSGKGAAEARSSTPAVTWSKIDPRSVLRIAN